MNNFARKFLKLFNYFNLVAEKEDFEYIHQEILKGIPFKGTNLWILIFAIFLASVGLNMNSTAVIIGAMLISPLMGPINGIGYSIATYDFELLKLSVRNFTFAVVTSLLTSTFYFALSPVSIAHSELLARTSPTIYDVLIALFGGLAGIIAISSKNKGNVIPGVAIATALMPPLCTVGYGLATWQPKFFFGAFYLFSINTIFIALAALWMSRVINFPIRTIVDKQRKIQVNRIITAIILIVLLPSFYFGYELVKQEKFTQNSNLFIAKVSNFEGNFLIKSSIDAPKRVVNLVYAGSELTSEQRKNIKTQAMIFNLSKENVSIQQGINMSDYLDDINLEKNKQLVSNEQVNLLKESLQKYELQEKIGQDLLEEIKAINPKVESLIYIENAVGFKKDSIMERSVKSLAVVKFKNDKNYSMAEKQQLETWLATRTKKNRIEVFFEP